MLDTSRSAWLPLQPLAPCTDADLEDTFDRALPGRSCSIEALRDTFAPLYYSPPAHPTAANHRQLPAITQASTRDLAGLLNLHSSTLSLRYDPAFFLSLLLNSNYIVLLARSTRDSNAITACATAFFNPYIHELELLTLCVDQNHQRTGLATALLRKLAAKTLEISRQASFTVTLRVQTTNKPAIGLYTRLGFTVQAMEPNYYKAALTGTRAAYKMQKLIVGEVS